MVEDLCLALRYVGVSDYSPSENPGFVSYIREVQDIYAELEKRAVDLDSRIALLSAETDWQMDALLRDCLAYPEVIPYVRENDGIRRDLRCYRCHQGEMPDRNGIWFCDGCLTDALRAIESKIPEDNFVLFRTYNPSNWCEHADVDTLLVALNEGDWIDEGYCRICLTEEQLRRMRPAVDASLAQREATGGAWELLTTEQRGVTWDRFYAEFDFRPSIYPKDWPGIREPSPSITYSISSIYKAMSNPRILENDLNTKTLAAIRKCVEPEKRLYVLDWQHDCYWLNPHKSFDAHLSRAWKVPVLPNGDYYIFIAEDFSFGLFGHPWEQTICVFGQVLLDAFAQAMPLLFVEPVRRNGKAV
ncbi:MAG TPA: DUF2716 domain-containing protein [Chloroflexia bacterium]|nr:DUF2716 domain-containing protein [Chloroflexia bacterium]